MAKGIKEFPTHKTNPYTPNLVIPSRNKTIAISNKQLALFDAKTGEVQEHGVGFMGLRKRVDTEEFVKIYKGQLQAMFDLSVPAYKMLGYFLHASRISSDTVIFRLNECKEHTGYTSKASVNKGMAELLEKEFIARTDEHFVYYINPAKFFNGDRLVLFQEIVKKGSEADKRLQQNDPLANLNQREFELEAPSDD